MGDKWSNVTKTELKEKRLEFSVCIFFPSATLIKVTYYKGKVLAKQKRLCS